MQTTQEQWEQQIAKALRLGSYLTGPSGRTLPAADWERLFQTYCDTLDELRRLVDRRRPLALAELMPPSTEMLAAITALEDEAA